MKSYFLLAIVACVCLSCKHDIPTVPDPEPQDTSEAMVLTEVEVDSICDPNKVYFVNDILPILTNSCAYSGCHDANSAADGIVLSSYNELLNSEKDDLIIPNDPGESELYEVLEKDRMPLNASPLSAAQKQLFFDWINQGALNNECLPDHCDTTNVSYSTDINAILSTYCISCHSGASAQKGVDLSDYTKLKAEVDTGKVRDAILGINGVSLMPQGNALPDCELNKFLKWIDNGAPNN